MRKVDNALQSADQQRLARFDNEFKKMKQYMDTVRSQLDNFHRDLGFEFDGIFEPFKTAESILNHGLNSINRQLHQAPYNQQPQNQAAGGQQGMPQNPPAGSQQAGYNQQNQQQQQGAQQGQQNPFGGAQQYQTPPPNQQQNVPSGF